METKILISGFGGQGLMSLGKFLARAALDEGKHTTWFPSYGAEMRGGTAHCFLKISDKPIASPFINQPDIAIIFNQPSLAKFKKKIKKKTLLIVNSNLINKDFSYPEANIISVPLNKIALDCGNIKVANTIAMGLLVSLKPNLISRDTITKILNKLFPKGIILDQNLKAFCKGQNLPVKKKGNQC